MNRFLYKISKFRSDNFILRKIIILFKKLELKDVNGRIRAIIILFYDRILFNNLFYFWFNAQNIINGAIDKD